MLRNLADNLYSKNSAVKWLKHRSPEEEIVFASAATFLEAMDGVPIGWSLRRFFQHRGVVIITRNQVIFKSSFLSFPAILYILLFILSVMFFLQGSGLINLLVMIFMGLLASQFLPYQRVIPLQDIRRVNLQSVQGMLATGSLLAVYVRNKVFNIVPAQLLNEDVMQVISSKKRV